MTAEPLWLPTSPCGSRCLPAAGTVTRVGPVRATARLVAAAGVVAMAAAALPLVALLRPAARVGLLRLLARALLRAFGVRHEVAGRLPGTRALLVANHVSWLDVPVLLAYAPVRLLAKREVRGWPVIGALAAAAGTTFIDRRRPRELPAAVAEVAAALRAGAVVAVFPEGTTRCGRATGRFRPAMFQAAVDAGVPVAPVTLRYASAGGRPTSVAAFVGEDTLLASLYRVVTARDLRVTVSPHPSLHPVPGGSRRVLARAARSAVRVATEPTRVVVESAVLPVARPVVQPAVLPATRPAAGERLSQAA
ncbi:lysophospholipid acyltransferase family protein [Planosporangium sp. 12N6]|uniref:lysophospholipid acyltransferase family protein n=1 Tax=Planosporangium spinosum TaxID=3402278 RepID=UPI003CF1988C